MRPLETLSFEPGSCRKSLFSTILTSRNVQKIETRSRDIIVYSEIRPKVDRFNLIITKKKLSSSLNYMYLCVTDVWKSRMWYLKFINWNFDQNLMSRMLLFQVWDPSCDVTGVSRWDVTGVSTIVDLWFNLSTNMLTSEKSTNFDQNNIFATSKILINYSSTHPRYD